MARVIVFDVNETLLDLAALEPAFARIFGDAAARREWFTQVLQSALTATVTAAYSDFGAIGMAALAMTAARRGTALTDADRHAIREGMQRLPAHPEVRESLERLRAGGLRLATLTNSTATVGEAQLANAGLRDCFEHVLSADTVRCLKPAPAPYLMAAERLGVPVGHVRLVAAHAWDVAGAQRVGCAAPSSRDRGRCSIRSPQSPISSASICATLPGGSLRWSGERADPFWRGPTASRYMGTGLGAASIATSEELCRLSAPNMPSRSKQSRRISR